MTSVPPGIAEDMEAYFRTGGSDLCGHAWPGASIMERAQRAHTDLLDALVAEVRRRAQGRHRDGPDELRDVTSFVRRKVGPMVRGLFSRAEHEAVLTLIESSVRFVGPTTRSSRSFGRRDGQRRRGIWPTCTWAASAPSCWDRVHRGSSG
jgi:hypothetical protein